MLLSISAEGLVFYIQVRPFLRDKAFLGAQETYLYCLVKPEQSRQSSCLSDCCVVADKCPAAGVMPVFGAFCLSILLYICISQ